MLMGPGDGRIHRDRPLQLPGRVLLTLDRDQDLVPRAVAGPRVEPVPGRLPRPELRRQVAPRGPGPRPPADPLHDHPVITPTPTAPRCPVRQQRLDPSQHLIADLTSTTHPNMLNQTRTNIRQTRLHRATIRVGRVSSLDLAPSVDLSPLGRPTPRWRPGAPGRRRAGSPAGGRPTKRGE